MVGFVYPNELEVNWGLLIVLYPYITGLVAGAFIVSALYHVFNRQALKPVGGLALLTALSFLLVAPLPLLLHLGQRFRAFNIMWTPNPTSAMAGFGYIYGFYLLLVALEVWFVFRADIVRYAESSRGVVRVFYNILSLGAKDTSDETLALDHRITRWLAVIGIPAAVLLHGYVGFIFGAIKANPWWSTALQPVIFLMSAVVSGIALLIVVYTVTSWLRRRPVDFSCLMSLNRYLWFFLVVGVGLEILEVIHKMYESREEWEALNRLLTDVMPVSFFGIQLGLGAAVPLVLLLVGRWSRLSNLWRASLTFVSGLLVLVGVYAMRFNVIIGGQLVSKTLAGFASYHASFFGNEGILQTVVLLMVPLAILGVLLRVLPPWVEIPALGERIPEAEEEEVAI